MSTKKHAVLIVPQRVTVSLTAKIIRETNGYIKEIKVASQETVPKINRVLQQHDYHNRKQIKQLSSSRRR